MRFKLKPSRLKWMMRTLYLFAALTALSFNLICAAPNLFFMQAPQGEVSVDSLVKVVVAIQPVGSKAPDSCRVYRSAVPVGDSLKGHSKRLVVNTFSPADGLTRVITFKASTLDSNGSPQLSLGIHYIVAACEDGKYVTAELPLWVASKQAVSIITPKAEETSSSPVISWSPVPGVPAYHILLSDQALQIDPAKGTVSGASVIWQAITTQTSIVYGTPDPSGNFAKVPAPPLSPNVPYNLVILNNYDGRSALTTSSKAQGLKLFTIKSSAAMLSKPINEGPANKTFTVSKDSLIRFTWTSSRAGAFSANTYKVYIYSLEVTDAAKVLLPIWQSEVTDTFLVLDAKRTLLSKRYIWKVFALNDAGSGVVGDTTSFVYQNDVQTLKLTTNAIGSQGDTAALGDVRIDVVPVDGSADALPLFTVNSGSAEKVLTVGSYTLKFSKNGYLTQSRTITLDLSAPLKLVKMMTLASSKVTGHIVDETGRSLDNAVVKAVGGGQSAISTSDAGGYFLVGATPGNQVISFAKADYLSPKDTVVLLQAGKTVDLGNVVLKHPTSSINGEVVNDKGAPLATCDVNIKDANGNVLRSLFTDDKGSFSVLLAPGNYSVAVSRAGFTGSEQKLNLVDAANVNFQLTSGASVIKGKISLITWPTAAASQVLALPGASLELVQKLNGNVVQKTTSDLRGEYLLSTDTGAYLLRVTSLGQALADSVAISVVNTKSTVSQDLSLKGFASIRGSISIVPDDVVNPSLASISLLNTSTFKLVKTAVPEAAPVSGGMGNMSFSLDGIADGNYRVTCGLPGFGLDLEPTVTINQSVWKTNLNLILRKATKSLTLQFAANAKTIGGTVQLLTPQAQSLTAGQKLSPAAAGTYTLTATPDSSELIQLSRYTFSLPSTGSADTTVNLNFPFSHKPIPLTFKNQAVEILLNSEVKIDSAVIVYGYGQPKDTLRIALLDLAGPPGLRAIKLKPSPQGGLLAYYFVIHSGTLTYANDDPAHYFRAQVESSHDLASLRVAFGDSLRLPANTRMDMILHTYDASGNRLDTAVDKRGTVSWSSDAGLPLKVGNITHRNSVVQTSVANSVVKKYSARVDSLRQTNWDTLRVNVTLDGISKSLAIPATVVSAVINKLKLSTTLGNISELSSPQSFGLFVSAFDTTLTPPLLMVPNPALTLVPKEAGMIQEMQVNLDPRFIGPVQIVAKQNNIDGSEAKTELGAERDSLQRGINVGQILHAKDSAKIFFHDPYFQIQIKDSALAEANSQTPPVIRMYIRSLAKTFTSGITYSIAGNLYEITNPTGAVFTKPLELALGIPTSARARPHPLRQFDLSKLVWKNLKDSVVTSTTFFGGPALSAKIQDLDGSYYGLLGESQALTPGEIEILPNPFSPLVLASHDGNTEYGTRIRLHPESARSSEVTVSISIFNLEGELVRHLVEHKTVPKAAIDFYWDGKADGGRSVRNGRYLVKIALNSTGTLEVKQFVRMVVVFL